MAHKQRRFDRVVVMDPVALTGHALCILADKCAMALYPCVYAPDCKALYRALDFYDGEYLLVITELTGPMKRLIDGLVMLRHLSAMQTAGRLRVMVFTVLDDPVLLKMVINCGPVSVCLRREPLDVLRRSMLEAQCFRQEVWLSPAVEIHMLSGRGVRATPREMEWLVTQVDGMNLHASAVKMSVSDKTAWTWRHRLTRQLGGKRAFIRYLAGLVRQVYG